ADLKLEVNGVRNEIKEEIASVRNELKEEIASVRNELKEEIASVRVESHSFKTEIIKWNIGTMVALVAIMLAVLRLTG
ncbi:MAG TPA: DUF1640 domain-containing protein, partial [Anaerolineae bacterium]|nr:DUF1640 domain-containing protein [Anaerolineae bacterium]